MHSYPAEQQMLFQCDHPMAQSMKKHKESAHAAMKNALHRKVRVQTMDDEVFEGVVINVDAKNVYIQIEQEGDRAFFPGYHYPRPPYFPYPHYPYYGYGGYGGYGSAILPLALFDLLAVGLLW